MSPKKTPAKAKKVAKKEETIVVTQELLDLNPTWAEEKISVGDEIVVPEDAILEAPVVKEKEEKDSPVTKESEEKEVVVSKRGTKTSNKDTIKKALSNEKSAQKLEEPLGEEAEYEIITNLKRNGTEYKIGEKATFEDSLAIRRLVESGCIKAI